MMVQCWDSGGLIGGLSSMGGISVDIAESMNFVQSITQMFDCDPEFECSPNDEHTLGEGGSGAKDEPNCAAIAEAADNASACYLDDLKHSLLVKLQDVSLVSTWGDKSSGT